MPELISTTELAGMALLVAVPGALIGGAIGFNRWKSNRAAGAILGAVVGAPLSLVIALGLIVLLIP
ncbi:MAG: hypothetical protein AB3N20_05860 [Rhizobiaceae bacterium]